MERTRGAPLAVVACALIGAGAVHFAAGVGAIGTQIEPRAIAVLGLVVVLYLAWTVDPAWLISAGLVATMFAGYWDQLGVPGSSGGPQRVLIVVGLLAVLLRAPPARERPPLRLGRVHFALAAVLVYALISALAAGTLGRRTADFVLLDEYGVLPFLLYLVAPVAFATERQRQILLGTLVAAGGYLAVTAVLERIPLHALVFPTYITDPGLGTHFGRARGPFLEAGANGLALYFCAVAAAIALTLWRRPLARACAAGVVVLAPVGLLLTVTRSVWLAGVIGTFVAVVTTPGLRRFLVPVVVAGGTAVVVALALIPGVAQQARDRQADQSSVYERQNTTAAGLRMIQARPLIGFGWDRGNDNIDPYFRLDPNIPLTGANAGFHNLYLQYGVNLGLLGLGLWLFAVALAAGGALARRGPPTIRPWQVGLKAILVAWAIVGLSTPGSYVFSTFLLWTWMGVASVPPTGAQRTGATTSSRSHGKFASASFG